MQEKVKFMRLQKLFVPVFAGLLCLGYSTSAIAQEMLRTITVSGQGDESVATSISQIQLGIQVTGETAGQVQAEAAERSTRLVTFLKEKNVEKLTTAGISLQPQYEYDDNGEYVQNGYIATNMVSFEVPTAQAGSIMDESVKAGATRIDGIYFRATDPAIDAAQKVAMKEAVMDAQSQAEVVLSALGFKPQEIVQIQVNGAYPPSPLYKSVGDVATMSMASTPVEGGEQTVNSTVTLTIRY